MNFTFFSGCILAVFSLCVYMCMKEREKPITYYVSGRMLTDSNPFLPIYLLVINLSQIMVGVATLKN